MLLSDVIRELQELQSGSDEGEYREVWVKTRDGVFDFSIDDYSQRTKAGYGFLIRADDTPRNLSIDDGD